MNLDYEQTFNDIDETKRMMTMKPSVETLSTFFLCHSVKCSCKCFRPTYFQS